MASENTNEIKIPGLVYHIAAQTGRSLIQRDIKQRPFMPAGPMFFTFSYWIFQTGALLGYGLRGHIGIIAKLVFEPGADTAEVGLYLKEEGRALLSKSGEPESLVDLYLVPLLASVGIDYNDKEFIVGSKSGWVNEKQYDMDILDKNAYLALRQGLAVGYACADVFEKCWQGTYAPKSREEWDEAYKNGMVDSPTQEILEFKSEVWRALGEAAEWAEKNKESGLTAGELEEMRGWAGHT